MAWAQPSCQHRCWDKSCTAISSNPCASTWCVKQLQALTYVEEHTVLVVLYGISWRALFFSLQDNQRQAAKQPWLQHLVRCMPGRSFAVDPQCNNQPSMQKKFSPESLGCQKGGKRP